jgi:hypothetical protein
MLPWTNKTTSSFEKRWNMSLDPPLCDCHRHVQGICSVRRQRRRRALPSILSLSPERRSSLSSHFGKGTATSASIAFTATSTTCTFEDASRCLVQPDDLGV